MFNLDTNVMAAQIAAKSTAEKKAFKKYFDFLHQSEGKPLNDILNDMASDSDISTHTFVSIVMYYFVFGGI